MKHNATQTLLSRVLVDHLQRPVADAVVLLRLTQRMSENFPNGCQRHSETAIAKNARMPEAHAAGFRETLWKGKPNVEQTVVMLPVMTGRVLDYKERLVSDAWLTSEPVVFDNSGLPEFPIRTKSDAGQDWSNDGGEFRLQSLHAASNLHEKDPESLLPVFVFEQRYRFGQFHFLPLSELDKPIDLKLQPLVHVEGKKQDWPFATARNHLDHFAGLLPTRSSEHWLRSGLLSKLISTKRRPR